MRCPDRQFFPYGGQWDPRVRRDKCMLFPIFVGRNETVSARLGGVRKIECRRIDKLLGIFVPEGSLTGDTGAEGSERFAGRSTTNADQDKYDNNPLHHAA